MADITLGDLIALVLQDLADAVEETSERARATGLRVGDVDLEIPAYLHVDGDPSSATDGLRLRLALPSSRDTPPAGRVGRVRLSIEAQPPPPTEGAR